MRVRDLGEFELIRRILREAERAGVPAGAWRVGPGDDAAVARLAARRDLVASTDALVEDVHFRWRTDRPAAVGGRALAAALSDLAATGATPLGVLLALELPPALPVARLVALVRGLVGRAARWGVPLAGGNLSRGPHTALTLTALGSVPRGRALRRDRARPGDGIFVTGALGAAALARARAEQGGPAVAHVPEPRLAAGARLARRHDSGACIDVSDGLLADLAHVLRASRVGAVLEADAVPRPRGLAREAARLGVHAAALVLAGGEDYELLFTARRGAPDARRLGRALGVPVARVGRVVREPGLRLEGAVPRRVARLAGWRHF